MSDLLPKADIAHLTRDVCFVPEAAVTSRPSKADHPMIHKCYVLGGV
jgi:hypothetical protein